MKNARSSCGRPDRRTGRGAQEEHARDRGTLGRRRPRAVPTLRRSGSRAAEISEGIYQTVRERESIRWPRDHHLSPPVLKQPVMHAEFLTSGRGSLTNMPLFGIFTAESVSASSVAPAG